MPILGNVTSYLPTTGRALAAVAITNAVQITPWVPARGFDFATIYIHYQRGAIGGAATLQLETQDSGYAGTYQQSAFGVGAVAVNVDTASNIQRQTVTYGGTAAAAEGAVWGPIEIRKTIEAWRIGYVETGVPGTPGILGLDWQMTAED